MSDDQHGFRRFHSTETCLLAVTDCVLVAMDRREISLLALLDLSKCFECFELIQKLEHYGVETTWFRSYLSDRRQRLCLPGERASCRTRNARRHSPLTPGLKNISDPLPNPIGVYQGTNLGPLLFNVFSADLGLYIENNIKIFQYADDTQLLISVQNLTFIVSCDRWNQLSARSLSGSLKITWS